MAVLFVFYLAHFMGFYSSDLGWRYFTPFAIGASGVWIAAACIFPKRISAGPFWAATLLALAVSVPTTLAENTVKVIVLNQETYAAQKVLSQFAAPERQMVISARPGIYLSLGYNSIAPAHAQANSAWIERLIRERLFENVLLVQRVRLADGVVLGGGAYKGTFSLKVVDSFPLGAGVALQVSQLHL
jgi:hypothetical protein